MAKEYIEEYWQELDDCKAEMISGGLQRLQDEFSAELATLGMDFPAINIAQSEISRGKSIDIPITIRRPPH
ncbi:hypothetical protein I8751_20960 [Nostocaceae cyanobacterium CENA357]|uniref:Uncharacterized protein n=1 Tax=Atlanticothrix silvestris CENA357 TaxID=1725252 RepID=A0A8J7HKM5_9CYAN|nr:hypothetical protein [Atlanticothrix silvestris]MBH8554779.1 hypothetical protein [Atlanticothrix silvestris CENA357]